ncbi:glycosyltransferase family 2 protein [Bacillus sp. NTK034]|nr:glycosyltransferase family 2 protein [Bacillus sp. NTK034]
MLVVVQNFAGVTKGNFLRKKTSGITPHLSLRQKKALLKKARTENEKSKVNKMSKATKNKPNLKISCILTSYNRPQRVREAIASVQQQTYPNWELIVVDDNSNAKTKNVLNEIADKDPRITLIQTGVSPEDRPKTTRYATCINLALGRITGDLVTYLTDDDIYYPTRFERMAAAFQMNPKIHVLYGRQKVIVYTGNRITRTFIRPLVGVTRYPMGRVDHNSFMHSRSCLEVVKGWDDHPDNWKAGDAAFFRKLVRHWDFYPINALTDEHRVHDKGVQRKLHRGTKPWNSEDAE